MTINEALAAFAERCHSIMSEEEQVRVLSELDGRIKSEIIDTHEGGGGVKFEPYGADVDRDTVLLVPFPYDGLYIDWLLVCEMLRRDEIERYNNALYTFKEALGEYARWYNRTHMPKASRVRY